MLILDQANTYGFSNTVVKVIDQTYEEVASERATTPVPEFNVLIPTVQAVGVTNAVELYQPGDVDGYVRTHGNPNALKYGSGPTLSTGSLSAEIPGLAFIRSTSAARLRRWPMSWCS